MPAWFEPAARAPKRSASRFPAEPLPDWMPLTASFCPAEKALERGLMDALRARIADGMPVYGSCAGLILLCRDIEGPDGEPLDQPRLGLLDATARRNAFGRQADSFECRLRVRELEHGEEHPLPAVFIRAPLITHVGTEVRVLAEVAETDALVSGPVAVRQGNILATSFHPELTRDTRMHRLFLGLAARERRVPKS